MSRDLASDWTIPGQVCVGDVEAGQVGEVGGQRAEVEAAEVVGAEGQGLQLSQSLRMMMYDLVSGPGLSAGGDFKCHLIWIQSQESW